MLDRRFANFGVLFLLLTWVSRAAGKAEVLLRREAGAREFALAYYLLESSSSSITVFRVSSISKEKRTMPESWPLTSK